MLKMRFAPELCTRMFAAIGLAVFGLAPACTTLGAGPPGPLSEPLDQASFCQPTFSAQASATAICGAGIHPTTQVCGTYQLWFSARLETVQQTCIYDGDGKLVSARIEPDAGPSRQFGSPSTPPTTCDPPHELCPGDAGASD